MKEIKRYYAHIKNGNGTELCYSINDCGDIVNYTDHKAVVENKEKLIKEQFDTLRASKQQFMDDLETIRNKSEQLETMQKRIEELEAEQETIKIQSNKYAKRLVNLGEDENIVWWASKKSIFNKV